ncbi:MAG TPA: hypothetical protein VK510_16460 [Solirubrobacteraceae bacterium]|nr:hypothetical protein [Solirubrobacteraceae bacterium]
MFAAVRQRVALDDRHLLVVVAQDPSGQQPGHAPAQHHSPLPHFLHHAPPIG